MNVFPCDQLSKEWFAVRLGMVTGSRVADALAMLKRKSGERVAGDSSQARENLKVELLFEIVTQKPSPHYVSKWMEEGREKEPIARTEYERAKEIDVDQVGFVFHPTIKMAGCSPDGLIASDGVLELKCPKYNTHIRYLIAGEVPKDYLDQCMWHIACTEREFCDFGSYNEELPRRHQLFIPPRLYRDEKRIKEMESGVIQFNEEVQEMLEKFDPEWLEKKLKASLRQRGVEPELGITEEEIRA